MEIWFVVAISLCICGLLHSVINLLLPSSSKLPPGPPIFPIISTFLWMRKPFYEIELTLRQLKSKYGPIITLRLGSRPSIFVAGHSTAHFALVQYGAIFSDRPEILETQKITTSNQHNISSGAYGPLWRLLRRNLTSEMLHPSRIKSFSRARGWVLQILVDRILREVSDVGGVVKVVDHFRYAMFCLLVLMCFGDRLEEEHIKQIETVQTEMASSGDRFKVLNFCPRLGRIVFRKRWEELLRLRRNQENVLIPLIRSRIEQKQTIMEDQNEDVVAYVDTLADLELPGKENRKLSESEMVTLCTEFLIAGTDTTSTVLQWIMANIVKYPQIQAKLYTEIKEVMGAKPFQSPSEMITCDEDFHRMPYLKAVVLEGLRRHPPAHFLLPHSATEDVDLEGYTVPKNGTINFMVAEMGWDPNVWEEPMEFRPERFLGGGDGVPVFDLTGSKEIKMMPFGAGRRICPGMGLGVLHLEYFVANLVWLFQWHANGDKVDLSEKQEFTVVMKYPLEAHIRARKVMTQEAESDK